MKKTNKVISVLLVAIIAISSLFGAVNVEAVSKIKKNKGDFYFQLKKTLYDNSNSSGSKHTYKIYAFNVNTKSAKSYNKKIKKDFIKYYNDDYDAYLNGYSMVRNVTGSTYKNGNILSIKQKATAPSWWQYKAYNLNKKTGKKVSFASLYKKYGYSKKSFYKALKKKQIDKTKAIIKRSPGLAEYADRMIAYAKSGESRKGLQVFLDSKGKLCAVAKIQTFAGAGIYQYIFKFSKK